MQTVLYAYAYFMLMLMLTVQYICNANIQST